MGKLQALYYKMPLFIQNIMISLYGFNLKRVRYGKEYYKYFTFLEAYDKSTQEEQNNYQLNELRKLVKHAKENCSFYAEFYKSIDPDDIKSLDDLKRLPVLTKDLVKANYKNMYCIPQRGAVISATGGTTGSPLKMRYRRIDTQHRMACVDYFRAKAGFINMKMRKAAFNARGVTDSKETKVFSRSNYALKQRVYSAFYLSEANKQKYIDDLNRFKPQMLEGYASAITDLADFILRTGQKLLFTPIALFPTAETITPLMRETMEKGFGCKVYNQYASSEGAPLVTECPDGVLHYETSTGIFEQIPDSNEVLVTCFHTYGTPLVRYQIGDSLDMGQSKKEFVCTCGSRMPIVKEIIGRGSNFLLSESGAKVSEAALSVLIKHYQKGVIKTQFIQHSHKEIELLMITDGEFSHAYEEDFRREFKELMGSGINLSFKYVDDIPKAASGKYMFLINNLTK